MAKKKPYKPPKVDGDEAERFKENKRLMDESGRRMREKYKKWWDFERHCWKDGFPGHNLDG